MNQDDKNFYTQSIVVCSIQKGTGGTNERTGAKFLGRGGNARHHKKVLASEKRDFQYGTLCLLLKYVVHEYYVGVLC